MPWTEEFIIILAYSTKTQISIILGIVSFLVTFLLGHYFSSSLVLHGALAPLTESIRQVIEHRYEHAAWGMLVAFLLLAVKCYKKDRKRLFSQL